MNKMKLLHDIISRLNQMGRLGYRCCPLEVEEIETVTKELIEKDDHYYLTQNKDGTTWLNWE